MTLPGAFAAPAYRSSGATGPPPQTATRSARRGRTYLRRDGHADLSEPEQDALLAAGAGAVRDAFYAALTALRYYPEHTGLDIRWDRDLVAAATRRALAAVSHHQPSA